MPSLKRKERGIEMMDFVAYCFSCKKIIPKKMEIQWEHDKCPLCGVGAKEGKGEI